MIQIVLADDHAMLRDRLARLVDREADMRVLATAEDGPNAVQAVAQHHPDVLVVDLMMPGIGGLVVTQEVTRLHAWVRVIVLSMHADEAYVREALRNGASGYVLKENSGTDLIPAIRQVAAGQRFFSAALAEIGGL